MLILVANFRKYLKAMRKLFIILLLLPLVLYAQFTESHSSQLRTLQSVVNGDLNNPPVITLNSDDEIVFSFDELSHTYRRYIYRVTHCNYDWSPSELHEIDYIDGFNDRTIDYWENSSGTTQLYTHYEFSLPNEDISLKVSGNYLVEVFDDDNEETPVAIFRFAVVDRRLSLTANVSGNTDIDYNKTHQQLSFKVGYSFNIQTPAIDIKPVVYQNRRFDNRVDDLKPTYITGRTLEYVNNKALIFDAGNEYRRFELTDPYSPGMNVERVTYFEPYFHADLYVDKPQENYMYDRDQNGRFYVNTLQGYDVALESDYALVHFCFDAPYRSGGNYYVLGDFCGNRLSDANIMSFDNLKGVYTNTQLLKFGLYNYQYVWVPRNTSFASTVGSEGNFYNTENEYLIFVYYREFGARYDSLLGVVQLNYNMEYN